MAKITCWDGVGCIGGNKILLEDGGTKIWLDFGLNFGRMGRFYEEYLKPKSCLGLYEPVLMGLLPPIRDLYRPDLACSLANPWDRVEARSLGDVDGILLSHAHVDHIGALSYVRSDIPVYSSIMTLAMAKATQDSGVGGVPAQYCYTTPYESCDTGELKAVHHAKGESVARPFVFVGESPSGAFSEFWASTPGSLTEKGRKHAAPGLRSSDTCGGLKVRRFPVDHSVYGACAWAIETSAGWVVYSGDLRCHGTNCNLSWEFAEQARELKPIALIMEGTRIESEESGTEDQVRERALEEVKRATGLVVADFGPRNVERLMSFLRIAKETGRKLLLLPKDAYLLEKMALAGEDIPSLDDESILIYSEYEGGSSNWQKALRARYSTKMIRPEQVAASQDKIICCFSFFDVNELAYIKPVPGSVWLFSSCEAFSEEMNIDFKRLGDWVEFLGMTFLGDPRKPEKSPFHVSGHACRTDLLKIIEIIEPKMLIPVHTERPDLYVELLAGKRRVQLPERGVGIEV